LGGGGRAKAVSKMKGIVEGEKITKYVSGKYTLLKTYRNVSYLIVQRTGSMF
jgi:hypothetical protein